MKWTCSKHHKLLYRTRGPSGPQIAHLDEADHDTLYCASVAILAIRSDSF